MSRGMAAGSAMQFLSVQGDAFATGAAAIAYGVIFLLLIAGLLSIVYHTIRNGISPMPSSKAARDVVAGEVERLVRAGVLSEQATIIEAGSGWGHLAFRLGRSFPKLSIIGVENSFLPLAVSRLVRRQAVYPNVKLKRGDLFRTDYADARLVVCYLYPGAMQRLRRIVEASLQGHSPRECWLISVGFAIPQQPPVRKVICRDLYRTPVYLYRLSA